MIENPYYRSDPGDEPFQDIDEKCRNGHAIKGFGKPQHGMNGKDADLDSGGQCIVKMLETLDPTGAPSMLVRIHLRQYANVCEPYVEGYEDETDEQYNERYNQAMDEANEIVCSESLWFGGWTGSDYWCFSNELHIDVPIEVELYEEIGAGDKDAIRYLCAELADAIYSAKELEPFENAMSELNEAIGKIQA